MRNIVTRNLDKFDYGQRSHNEYDWVYYFERITRLLFPYADTISFYKGIFDALIDLLKADFIHCITAGDMINTVNEKVDELKCIRKYILAMYDHGIPRSLFGEVNNAVTAFHGAITYTEIASYRQIFFNYYHEVLSSEAEDRVYDRTALDRILAIQKKIKKNISWMVYDLLELYRVNDPQPRMCNEGLMTDFDGNQYKTVRIGDQCWMAENLRVRHFNNGDPIPLAQNRVDVDKMDSLSQAGYCYYTFDGNQSAYGLFYNGFAALDKRGLAPPGWRFPTRDDNSHLSYHLLRYELALELGPEIFCAGAPREDKPGMNLTGFGSQPYGGFIESPEPLHPIKA